LEQHQNYLILSLSLSSRNRVAKMYGGGERSKGRGGSFYRHGLNE
jgi:hypothetical protein